MGAADYTGTYGAQKLVNEPAHFSWTGLVADAAGSVAAAAVGPTGSEQKAGITGKTYAKTIGAHALQDVVSRETSVALGDHHVQSWQQVGEDIFGNALGNAAAAGINAYRAKNAPDHINTMSPADTAPPSWDVDDVHVDMSSAVSISSAPSGAVYTGIGEPSSATQLDGGVGPFVNLLVSADDSNMWGTGTDAVQDHGIEMAGYTGTLDPYQKNGLDVTDLTPVTTTASVSAAPLGNGLARDGSTINMSWLLNSFTSSGMRDESRIRQLDQQLADTRPGSAQWTQLMQRKAALGLSSSNYAALEQGRSAASVLEVDEQMAEMKANGGRLYPVDSAYDPRVAQARQRQLTGMMMMVAASDLPVFFAMPEGGMSEAVPGMGEFEPVYSGSSELAIVPISRTPLLYDISNWGTSGLPSDGYFVRSLTQEQYVAMKNGLDVNFGGQPMGAYSPLDENLQSLGYVDPGYPNGMGFIGSAEQLTGITTRAGYMDAMKLDYAPKYLLEFQLNDPTGLYNTLHAPYSLFEQGGLTRGTTFSEFNYPQLNSKSIVNPRFRELH